MAYVTEHINIENAKIINRNFSGKIIPPYGRGQKTFTVVFDKEIAYKLYKDGWNIKGKDFLNYVKMVDDGLITPEECTDDISAYLSVEASWKIPGKEPVIHQIANERMIQLNEETVAHLDDAAIENIDLDINPYNWTDTAGVSHVKAYLAAMFVTLKPSAFYDKYKSYFDVPTFDDGSLDEPGDLPFEL